MPYEEEAPLDVEPVKAINERLTVLVYQIFVVCYVSLPGVIMVLAFSNLD